MRGPALLVLLAFLVVALSGCASDPAGSSSVGSGKQAPTGSASSSHARHPTTKPSLSSSSGPAPEPSDPTPSPTSPPPPGPPGSQPENETYKPEWPPIDRATIRPGVQVNSPAGQCTSNFVFYSPVDGTRYLGLAAHCVEGMKLDGTVQIDGATQPGTLVYSSWITQNAKGCPDRLGDPDCQRDFALVRIAESDWSRTHPAMLHFGGPVGLAGADDIGTGQCVLTYGNSGLRAGLDPTGWHEGVVTGRGDIQFDQYTVTPGIPGDSGSGVLLKDGKAAGVVVTIEIAPVTGQNGVVILQNALKFAKEKAGIEVELGTWNLLDAGVLPC